MRFSINFVNFIVQINYLNKFLYDRKSQIPWIRWEGQLRNLPQEIHIVISLLSIYKITQKHQKNMKINE